jgi:uncharacterized membrane protein YqaE (UPF0057 family)
VLYLLAIVLPPVAVLLTGKPVQALLNVLLTLCFWVPGVIHAMLVVGSAQADKRTRQIVKSNERLAESIERQTREQLKAEQRAFRRDAQRDR